MDGGELEDVPDAHVPQARHGEEVARGEDIFAACYGCNDVSLWLRADE